MKVVISTSLLALALVSLAACNGAARQEPVALTLQPTNGTPITLEVPRGYIEEPKKPEGSIPNVVLRIPAGDFAAPETFVAESDVRIAMEPNSSDADAGKERHAAALRKHRSSVEALVKSQERSRKGLIAYSYPNGEEPDAEAYFLSSKTGDVFVECRRSVCKAYKTWKKQVHTRFDFRPVATSNVEAVDASIAQMLESFGIEGKPTK